MSLSNTDLINENLLDLDVSYSSFTGGNLPKVISFRGGLNNKFCSDTDSGLRCVKDTNNKEEQFIVESLGGDFVALRSAKNYKYISDTPEGLKSGADVIDNWERFKVESLGGNQIALKGGRTGRYVTQLPLDNILFGSNTNLPNFINKLKNEGRLTDESIFNMHKKSSFSGKLVAEGTSVGEWQKFSVFPIGSTSIPTTISFKSELGKFCVWNPETNRIVCNNDASGLNFNIERIGGNLISFRTGNRYLSDQPDGIRPTANKALSWEIFNYIDLGNGKFALKGGRSNKYCRDTANGLVCDSDSYNNGGVFTLSSPSSNSRGGAVSGEMVNPIEATKSEEQKQQEAIQREQEFLESQKILGMPRKTAMIVGISLGVLLLGITTIIIIKKVKSKK